MLDPPPEGVALPEPVPVLVPPLLVLEPPSAPLVVVPDDVAPLEPAVESHGVLVVDELTEPDEEPAPE